ncbi:MAG: sigma 54-interacting transcriptional regulator [Bryobacterales bacterium]|nr:sigma 54-interacting transcriptional regulator [Bryobacterales bacterium]
MPIFCLSKPSSAPRAVPTSIEFLPGPHCPETIARQALESLRKQTAERGPDWPVGVDRFIGCSGFAAHLHSYLPKVAARDCNVLITGETGTGKELVAECIHRLSARRAAPWVALNCAALPEALAESELFGYERGAFTGAHQSRPGKFEMAMGGSIFLDEIGELPLSGQAKLLRVLESRETTRIGGQRPKPMRARIIAATNQEADKLVREGRFRADLFYRLNVVRIHVPPMRERPEDVPLLLDHLARGNREERGPLLPHGFAPAAVTELSRYPWPGNVREMRNLVESLAVLDPPGPIGALDLPSQFRESSAGANPESESRIQLASALAATNWNKSEAARLLSWSRMTVYRKLQKFGLRPDR